MKTREMKIKGVSISCTDDGNNSVNVDAAGRIDSSRFVVGQAAGLVVDLIIDPGLKLYGYKLGNDKPHRAEELSFDDLDGGRRRYERRMRINKSDRGIMYPDPGENIIRLIGVTPEGVAVMYNIAVVSQVQQGTNPPQSAFYLTIQSMFAEQAYVDDRGYVVIPGLQRVMKWKLLGRDLEPRLEEAVETGLKLPPLSEYVETEAKAPAHGQVLWYSQHTQTGCIWDESLGEEISVHWSHIRTDRGDGLMYLLSDESVIFKARPRNQRPGQRSGFKHEATEVSVVEDILGS